MDKFSSENKLLRIFFKLNGNLILFKEMLNSICNHTVI